MRTNRVTRLNSESVSMSPIVDRQTAVKTLPSLAVGNKGNGQWSVFACFFLIDVYLGRIHNCPLLRDYLCMNNELVNELHCTVRVYSHLVFYYDCVKYSGFSQIKRNWQQCQYWHQPLYYVSQVSQWTLALNMGSTRHCRTVVLAPL